MGLTNRVTLSRIFGTPTKLSTKNMAAYLLATTTNPPPPGHVFLPLRWWLRPHKIVRPDQYLHQISPITRTCMYSCRNGPIWIGNNWHSYRVHFIDSPGFSLPLHKSDGVWYYNGGPVQLEPVTRLQLLMESLWTES
jgi:hypothetical protein